MYGQSNDPAAMQQQLMVRRATRRAPRVARPSFCIAQFTADTRLI
jgi:hypothetical protein